MLLVVDVGNTTTEFGVFEGEELKCRFRYMTKQARTSDETGVLVSQMLVLNGLSPDDIDGCILSSVVPDRNFTLINTLMRYVGVDPMLIEPGIKTGILLKADDPHEVGADRVVDAVAAYALYGGPVLVLKFGTATRYDYVDSKGEFTAAITAPGIQISADALMNQAALLPAISLEKPASILAKNTVTSMQAGIVYGQIGQTEYIVAEIRRELGINVKTVASGGYANVILPYTSAIDVYDPLLSLKGLKILYDKNRK